MHCQSLEAHERRKTKSSLGEMKKDKAIIQYARKAGLATNQRWSYLDGYIFPTAAPHLVLDIRVTGYSDDGYFLYAMLTFIT